jgi:potassium-transporting ATPase KdpC subunit
MWRSFGKSTVLLFMSLVVVCGVSPLVLWLIGQTVFPFQANGSILRGPDGKPVGSLLIAQPFTKDEYFQPRPSASSYAGDAGSSSALSANNYALRDRVARQLGPIVTYAGGPKGGKPVAPDVEAWFQKDQFGGSAHIVAQWADAHNSLAQGWVNAHPKNAAYVDAWSKSHPQDVAAYVKANPGTPHPKAADLAVTFFESFSKEHPGMFPSAVTRTVGGKSVTSIEPVKEGSDIQSIFFDMWRQDHPDVALADVPGDQVTTSGSGLDPHITLQNAESQLDRVSQKWAGDLKRDPAAVRGEIEHILQTHAQAPLAGLAGERLINVLQVNLELRQRYGEPK